jgi:tetratricopeptide (TPR) repeat protein
LVLLFSVLFEPLRAEPILSKLPGSLALSDQNHQEVPDAIRRFNTRDFDGALKLLDQAVSKDPDLPPARILMAELFAQSKQSAAVRESLERAAIEKPSDPEAFILLGDMARSEGRITEADLLYARAARSFDALKSSPKRQKVLTPRLLAGQAAVAQARQNWPTALKHLEAWVAFDPENATPHETLAQILFQQHRPEEALAQLRTAAKLDQQLLAPEALLAQFYEATGDREHATQWMTTALRAAPKDLHTLVAAAKWSIETGQYDQAAELTARATALDPKSIEANFVQGTLELLLKDYEAAERHLLLVLQRSPTQFTAIANLALALCEQDDEAKKRRALEYAQLGVREYPDRAEAYATLGRVLYRFGRVEEAEKALRAAATHGDISPDAACCLARIDAATQRTREARQLLVAALKGKGIFMQRQEARALLEQLGKLQEPTGK